MNLKDLAKAKCKEVTAAMRADPRAEPEDAQVAAIRTLLPKFECHREAVREMMEIVIGKKIETPEPGRRPPTFAMVKLSNNRDVDAKAGEPMLVWWFYDKNEDKFACLKQNSGVTGQWCRSQNLPIPCSDEEIEAFFASRELDWNDVDRQALATL